MGYASYLVWQNGGGTLPLTLYGVQLLLNLAWSPIFFRKHEIGFALLDLTGASGWQVLECSPARTSNLASQYMLLCSSSGCVGSHYCRVQQGVAHSFLPPPALPGMERLRHGPNGRHLQEESSGKPPWATIRSTQHAYLCQLKMASKLL